MVKWTSGTVLALSAGICPFDLVALDCQPAHMARQLLLPLLQVLCCPYIARKILPNVSCQCSFHVETLRMFDQVDIFYIRALAFFFGYFVLIRILCRGNCSCGPHPTPQCFPHSLTCFWDLLSHIYQSYPNSLHVIIFTSCNQVPTMFLYS